jgi:hypothetical protein
MLDALGVRMTPHPRYGICPTFYAEELPVLPLSLFTSQTAPNRPLPLSLLPATVLAKYPRPSSIPK